MAETIDIRELNERIERQSAFVTNLTYGHGPGYCRTKAPGKSLLIGLFVRRTCVVGKVRLVWQKHLAIKHWH